MHVIAKPQKPKREQAVKQSVKTSRRSEQVKSTKRNMPTIVYSGFEDVDNVAPNSAAHLIKMQVCIGRFRTVVKISKFMHAL